MKKITLSPGQILVLDDGKSTFEIEFKEVALLVLTKIIDDQRPKQRPEKVRKFNPKVE